MMIDARRPPYPHSGASAEAARQGPWVNETLHLDVSDLRELAYVRAQPASTAEARSEHAGRRGGTCRRRRFNPHAIAYRYGELPSATLRAPSHSYALEDLAGEICGSN